MRWDEMRWHKMRWHKMRWDEMRLGGMRWDETCLSVHQTWGWMSFWPVRTSRPSCRTTPPTAGWWTSCSSGTFGNPSCIPTFCCCRPWWWDDFRAAETANTFLTRLKDLSRALWCKTCPRVTLWERWWHDARSHIYIFSVLLFTLFGPVNIPNI